MGGSSSPTRASSAVAFLFIAARGSGDSSSGVPSVPRKMLAAMSRFGASISSWWMSAIPSFLADRTPSMTTGFPSIRISPESGGWTPPRIFMSVLLPAPFSPISASTSPPRAKSDTSRNAVTPAKRLPMPRISRRGAAVAAGSPASDEISVVLTDVLVGYERFSSASLALKPATLLLSIKSTPVSML